MSEILPEEVQIRFDALIRRREFNEHSYMFIYDSLGAASVIVNGDKKEGEDLDAVTYKDLIEGVRQNAIDSFGNLAVLVFQQWGISCTEDLGTIVESLIYCGILRGEENDDVSEFIDGFKGRTMTEALTVAPTFEYDRKMDRWEVTYE